MPIDPINTVPRNESPPLFNPHTPTFNCEVEATKVPALDAEADAWFLEARTLESPDTIEEDRDYKKIVELTSKAAERKHWKAMLNLASLYLEKRDPARGAEDALRIVEEAMLLGIPAAYDRMGTYYMNGTGVGSDATRAFAFWQKAAQMGNPHAMTFLANKLDATYDSPDEGFWANMPVAAKMLECAFGQGYGPAAEGLSALIAGNRPVTGRGNRTAETSARAVEVLHDGVKLGCAQCANSLRVEFSGGLGIGDILPPHVDQARSERYGVIGDALSYDPDLRFPNLDQVLPLPPAPLPSWDGDRETLRNAAMGVKPRALPPKSTAASMRTERHFLDASFLFRRTGDITGADCAPRAGYWQPTSVGNRQPDRIRAQLDKIPPGLYRAEDWFERVFDPTDARDAIFGVVWERWDARWHNYEDVFPRAVAGLIREVETTAPISSCPAGQACPATGVWQPWVPVSHSLHGVVNQHWRQVWLTKGQHFPRPEQDWLLPLPEHELTWHLMDDTGVNMA